MYDNLLVLVFNTGIGVSVYTALDIAKPWLKGFFSLPWIKQLVAYITNKSGATNADIYAAIIRVLVFVIAYVIAWQMGAKGDLLVLTEYTTETSYFGYGLTALLIAGGDIAVDAYTQIRKGEQKHE